MFQGFAPASRRLERDGEFLHHLLLPDVLPQGRRTKASIELFFLRDKIRRNQTLSSHGYRLPIRYSLVPGSAQTLCAKTLRWSSSSYAERRCRLPSAVLRRANTQAAPALVGPRPSILRATPSRSTRAPRCEPGRT